MKQPSHDSIQGRHQSHTTQQRQPPPAFATTSTETIDSSIGFGFAVLIYVSLEIFRQFYIYFVDIRHEIRVFTYHTATATPPPAFSTTTRKSPDFRADCCSAASIYLCATFSDQVHSFLSCYTVKKRSPGP
jgi:hypothetical protein